MGAPRRVFRNGLLAVLLLGGSLLSWVHLFQEPPTGLANNGDFPKLAGRLSLAPAGKGWSEAFEYIHRTYERDPRHRWEDGAWSIAIVYLRLANGLGRLFEGPDRFDIRWAGAVYSTFFLIALALLARLLAGLPAWIAFPAAGLALLIFADAGYVVYFNSFFMDAGAIVSLWLVLVCAFLLARRPGGAVPLLSFTLCAILLVLSKPPIALLAPALSLWLLWTCGRTRPLVSALCAVGITVPALLFALHRPPSYSAGTLVSVIFKSVAGHSPDPDRTLAELGLDASYRKYVGQYAYSAGMPLDDQVWRTEFLRRTGYGKLAVYYFRHPRETAHILDRILENEAWELRQTNLGNFERSTGLPPFALSKRWCYWTDWRSRLARRWPLLEPVWLALFGLAGLAGWITGWIDRRFAPLCVLIPVLAAIIFFTASLADAVETPRHLFFYHALADVTFYLAVVGAGMGLRTLLPAAAQGPVELNHGQTLL